MKKKDFSKLDIEEQVQQVDKALEADIMPMLASHGGGLEIYDIQEWKIYIRYYGACHGCPLAGRGTLELIERALQSHINEKIKVIPV